MESGGSRTDSRWLALIVLCAGMLMIVLDQTIVNVALPAIEDDLKFGQAGLAWVVNAYLIAYGGLLLLAGRLGDLIGHKKVFLIGLGVFTVASVLCGLSFSAEMLIISRFVQGAGGALATSVTLGMVVTMFPKPEEQRRAIGVFSFVAAAGASIGLLLGGVLTDAMSWHWIFFVNIPIGLVAAFAAVRLVPDSVGLGLREGADVLGALPDRGRGDARRLHDRQGRALRLRLGAHVWASVLLRWRCWWASCCANGMLPSRCCRCGCSSPAT